MRIVNRRRFTIACMVFGFLLGLTGYGLYRGGMMIWEMITATPENEQVETIKQEEVRVSETVEELAPSTDPFLEDLMWTARWVLGCESEIKWQDGTATLNFEVNPDLALEYYPKQEVTTRLLKQTLKLLRDMSGIEALNQVQQLEVTYQDQRFVDADQPSGQVLAFNFDGAVLRDTDWKNETWQTLNTMRQDQ